jgi:hypothetical protein
MSDTTEQQQLKTVVGNKFMFLDDPGSIHGSAKLFSSPKHPDRFWGPPSLLSNVDPGDLFSGGRAAGG